MERMRLLSLIQKFNRADRGAIGVIMAVAAPVIIGVAGLAVDYNVWKKEKTELDRVTESAAMAAAFAQSKGVTDVVPYAVADATRNGFDPERGTLTVSFDAGRIAVDIESHSDRFLSSVISREPVVIAAKAAVELVEVQEIIEVENTGIGSGYACVTALDSNPINKRGIYMHDTAYINATGCGVHSNDVGVQPNPWTEESSIYMRNADIQADFIRSVGETVVNSENGNTTTGVEPQSNADVFVDPFASLTAPTVAACSNQGQTVNSSPTTTVLQPGSYCGDIIIQNGAKVRFEPGVYNIVNGDLLVRGGSSILDSEGVTFYFSGENTGNWIIDNGTDVALSAPTVGDTAGMLFWQSVNASCDNQTFGTTQNRFAGGVDFKFEGVIYAPNCGIVIDNHAQLTPANANAHMSMHAGWIEIRGNLRLS